MSTEARDVQTDVLFVGMTRPATKWGVPYTALVLEFMGVNIAFLAVGNPLYLLLALPVHGVMYLICAEDPGAFESVFLWLKTVGRSLNNRFWGSATFSPLTFKRWPTLKQWVKR
jgi:type IV secretion system protein VirB3